MFSLEHKLKAVLVIFPEIVLEGKAGDVIGRFEDNYLEVKERKRTYFTKRQVKEYFSNLPPAERRTTVQSISKGLSEVVVIEDLDGRVVERSLALVEELRIVYGANSLRVSRDQWECLRDLELFFPYLEAMPVERTLALIKPDGLARGAVGGRTLEEVVEAEVAAAGLFVVGKRRTVLNASEAEALSEDLRGTADHAGAVGVLLTEPGVIAFCLEGRGAVEKWLLLCGPTNAGVARERAPATLRARWGTDSTSNAVHGSVSLEASERELATLFPAGSLKLQRTLCIVKPDAMPHLLQIRMDIEAAGFTIIKQKQMVLSPSRARDFYQGHKDKPYFNSIVAEASSGPCCVMVLCRLEAVHVWQQLVGPESSREARILRPRSLRARFGRDRQRNAVHGSESLKSANREIRFFFPELGVDPHPDDEELRDFLFRKSAGASMDLKSLTDTSHTDFTVDPTLQQILSRGLMALCQVQPKGMAAIRWLSTWLHENNPNKLHESAGSAQVVQTFDPPDRLPRFVEYGVNHDGMPFAVEAPSGNLTKKQVLEVDVSEEQDGHRSVDFAAPPFVVFVTGGPGSGKGTQCKRLRDEFNLVHLSTGDLMRDEVAAETHLGSEIKKHMQVGTLVPDAITLQLLKKVMAKHQDTNRFLLDGFPRSVEQAKLFEQEVAEVAFVLYFEVSHDTMRSRIAGRAASEPGRVDDNPATVERRLQVFDEQTLPVVEYYGPIGRVRRVSAEAAPEEVYTAARACFLCRCLYLLGPPGAPSAAVARRLQERYGYAAIDLPALLQAYGDSGERDAAKVKAALAKGRPVEASIACPLVLAEVYRDMALGAQNFVICGFPQSLQQAQFLQYRVPCSAKTLLLDFPRADADDLAAFVGRAELEARTATFFGQEAQDMLKALPGLVRIPCTLSGLGSTGEAAAQALEGSETRLLDATWQALCTKVKPGLVIVLGPPCSGTRLLASLLADRTPNTYAVDCNQLLDKELERQTEIGITMRSMLARGQVVPLSVTLELLKNLINLTCSDSLVVENFPMYVDQVELISAEFRIERVFYIAGDGHAMQQWKETYIKECRSDDPSREAKAFDERAQHLRRLVSHFSRLGMLESLAVTATPDANDLVHMVDKVMMPRFVLISSPLQSAATEQASLLASCGAGTVVSESAVEEWSQSRLNQPAAASDPELFLPALRNYADAKNISLVILERYPRSAEDSAAFLRYLGEPALIASITCDDESLEEEYKATHEDEDIDPEELTTRLQHQRAAHAAMLQVFQDHCPSTVLAVDRAAAKTAEDANRLLRQRLLPKLYVLVGPNQGALHKAMAESICNVSIQESRPRKITVLDANEMFNALGHRAVLQDKLRKVPPEGPDMFPLNIWADVFSEAFAESADPMGTFLLINFPMTAGVTRTSTRFAMLESIVHMEGILLVRFSEASFTACCSGDPDELESYLALDSATQGHVAVQFGTSQICECTLDNAKNVAEAADKVAAEFLAFREKASAS